MDGKRNPTLPKFNIYSPRKVTGSRKEAGSSSNHRFSGAFKLRGGGRHLLCEKRTMARFGQNELETVKRTPCPPRQDTSRFALNDVGKHTLNKHHQPSSHHHFQKNLQNHTSFPTPPPQKKRSDMFVVKKHKKSPPPQKKKKKTTFFPRFAQHTLKEVSKNAYHRLGQACGIGDLLPLFFYVAFAPLTIEAGSRFYPPEN